MEVKQILKMCATMLQLKDIGLILDSSEYLDECENKDLNLLKDCVNLVCNTIACDYINAIKSKLIDNKTGEINFSDISEDRIYKILKVKNVYGDRVPFTITTNGIICDKGSLSITYSYFPREYGFNDQIDVFKTRITERVFAFGVCSEYLYILGNSDDASIFEDRFKNAMRNIVRKQNEIIMPKRRWW